MGVGRVGSGGVGHRNHGFEGAPEGAVMKGIVPQPIVLDQKPDLDNALTVAERIVCVGIDVVCDCGVDV